MSDAEEQEQETTARTLVQRSVGLQRTLRPALELAEGTAVGDAYLDSLIRTQRLLAVRLLLAVALVLGGVPVAFLVEPRLRPLRVIGVPVWWVLLVGGFYPLFLVVAGAFVRRSDRNESEFVELVTGAKTGS